MRKYFAVSIIVLFHLCYSQGSPDTTESFPAESDLESLVLEEEIMQTEDANTTSPLIQEDEPITEMAVIDTIPPEHLGLDYGYKGYKWGTSINTVPRLAFLGTSIISRDDSVIKMKGQLGKDTVIIAFAYADSGFWKVEIDYYLGQPDVDKQIAHFSTVEKSITEIYGPPTATNQVISGPASSYSDLMNIKYIRAFYRSSWKVTPCNIELLLNSIVQTPATDLSIIAGSGSILKLVYYNPDYMILQGDIPQQEELPSIFDIY